VQDNVTECFETWQWDRHSVEQLP